MRYTSDKNSGWSIDEAVGEIEKELDVVEIAIGEGSIFALEEVIEKFSYFSPAMNPFGAAYARLSDGLLRMISNPVAPLIFGDKHFRQIKAYLNKISIRPAIKEIKAELKVSIAAGAAISVISNWISAEKLGDELDLMFREMPFLLDHVGDDVFSQFLADTTSDAFVLAGMSGTVAAAKWGWVKAMGKAGVKTVGRVAGGVASGAVMFFSDPITGTDWESSRLPSSPDDAVLWSRKNQSLVSETERLCASEPSCVLRMYSGNSGSVPLVGTYEFSKIKRDYLRALGHSTELYDWVDRYDIAPESPLRLIRRQKGVDDLRGNRLNIS